LVVDTSALLAVIFDEPLREWAREHLRLNRPNVQMSTVNYAEALILSAARFPNRLRAVERSIEESVIRLVPPDARHAEIAAVARLRYPLNLGDCFAYALAKEQDSPLLTLDRDFRKCDIQVVLPRIH
jgi:ribonuclease VapC